MWVLLLFLGCSGEQDTGTRQALDTNPPPFGSDTGYGVPGVESPGLDLAGVEAALAEALSLLRSVDPVELFDLMEQLLSEGDSGVCPSTVPTNSNFTEYDDACTANSGASYALDLRFLRESPGPLTGGGLSNENANIVGGSRIVDSAGSALDFSLNFSFKDTVTTAGNRKMSGAWIGVATWGGADERSWLGEGVSGGFEYLWYTGSDSTTPIAFSAVGGLAMLPGTVVETLDFKGEFGAEYSNGELGFTVVGASMGSQCEGEPHGAINLRTVDGEWYTIAFQAPVLGEAPEDPGACDGCGIVTFRGEELGEICPDLGPFLNWEGRPW